jgi:hypothetical protein
VIHPKAMPVILTMPAEVETWLTAPSGQALALKTASQWRVKDRRVAASDGRSCGAIGGLSRSLRFASYRARAAISFLRAIDSAARSRLPHSSASS